MFVLGKNLYLRRVIVGALTPYHTICHTIPYHTIPHRTLACAGQRGVPDEASQHDTALDVRAWGHERDLGCLA